MKTQTLREQFSVVKPGDVGIIGDPIEHSLSPLMQNAAFKTWSGAFRDRAMPSPVYHKFLVKPNELEEAIRLMKEHQMNGLNVTVPHKVAVCQHVDHLSAFAQRAGAVNTLSYSDNKVTGLNTDTDGFKRVLSRDMDFDPEGKTIFIFGAGGTGRVIAHSLLDLQAIKIFIWNRTPTRLEGLLTDLNKDLIQPINTLPDVMKAVKEAHLVVNATTMGLREGDGLPVEGIKFSPEQFVFDVIYNRETSFIKAAKAAGANAWGGLGMLVYQGARSFEIWTKTPAPVEIMKSVLTQSLQGV